MNASAIDWKSQSRRQWNRTPCGVTAGDKLTLEYFRAVERQRYDEYAPWIKPLIDFSQYQGKKVLEIGFGQGTDLVQFADAGARCCGVDLTEHHVELARRNLGLRGLDAELFLEDGAKLHFADETFDAVYSMGVLHHTPDTIRCIGEAWRVLKPGGEFIVGLYRKFSAFHLLAVLLHNGILRRRLKKLGYAGLLSTIETGADGTELKPLVKLFSHRVLRTMLSDFRATSLHVKHLQKEHFLPFARLVPGFAVRLLESWLGWYVIAKAVK